VKLSGEGVAVTVDETTNVTLTICDVAPGAEMVTVPEYVFALKPVVLTETLTDPGVVPGLTGVAESHEPPVGLVAVEAVIASPELPPTVTVCATGAVPPSV
jgi:hypothetical protein